MAENYNRDELVGRLKKEIEYMYTEASAVVSNYATLMIENSEEAVKKLPNFIERARIINEEKAFVEAVAGVNQEWTAPLFNILGLAYPYLNRELRKEGLMKCIAFLDRIRYDNAQDHIALINEPLLVADVISNRPLYWCGYKPYCDLLEKNPTWKKFEQYLNSCLSENSKFVKDSWLSDANNFVKSEFWLAFTIAKPKYSSLEIRTNFYKRFPDLMDRTKDAIAAISYEFAQNNAKLDGKEFGYSYIGEQLSGFDTILYDSIEKKIDEKKWIKLENS